VIPHLLQHVRYSLAEFGGVQRFDRAFKITGTQGLKSSDSGTSD
jgi:hypothetical protein